MHMLNKLNLENWKIIPSSVKEKSSRGLDLARRLEISFSSHVLRGPNQLN